MTSTSRPASQLCAAIVLGLGFVSASLGFEWNGSAGSDFASASSWKDAAPVAGGVNNGDLYIVNGEASPLTYTEAQGVTRFDCPDFKIGNSAKPGGSLFMSGGELTVTSLWAPMIGHNNNQTSTLTLTGGKLTFNTRSNSKPGERSLRVGNWRGSNTLGILNLTGGILTVNTPGDIGLGGLIIACSDANGEVTLGGGLLVVTSIFGTSFQPLGGSGVGILTFGPGDGIFMQTESKQIIFGPGGGDSSYINFLGGSRGQLSFAGATQPDFEQWVLSGKIRIDGQQTTPTRFRYLSLDGQGIYLLAPPVK